MSHTFNYFIETWTKIDDSPTNERHELKCVSKSLLDNPVDDPTELKSISPMGFRSRGLILLIP